MDLVSLPEKEKYATDTTALTTINKFIILHGYGVTEQ